MHSQEARLVTTKTRSTRIETNLPVKNAVTRGVRHDALVQLVGNTMRVV